MNGYLQTQQEGKRNQSMKTPAQSLLGSYAISRCHLYFCSHEQSRAHRSVADPLQGKYFRSVYKYFYLLDIRADLLVHRLLELLVVEDGAHLDNHYHYITAIIIIIIIIIIYHHYHLPVAVARPEWGGHLHLGLAHVKPGHCANCSST